MKNTVPIRQSRATTQRPAPSVGQRYRHADGYLVTVLAVTLALQNSRVLITREGYGKSERPLERFTDEILTQVDPDVWEPRFTLQDTAAQPSNGPVSYAVHTTVQVEAVALPEDEDADGNEQPDITSGEIDEYLEQDRNYRSLIVDLVEIIGETAQGRSSFRQLL